MYFNNGNQLRPYWLIFLLSFVSGILLNPVAYGAPVQVKDEVKHTKKKIILDKNKRHLVRKKKLSKKKIKPGNSNHKVNLKSINKSSSSPKQIQNKTTQAPQQVKPVQPLKTNLTVHSMPVLEKQISKSHTPFYSLSSFEKKLVNFVRNTVSSMQYTKYKYGGNKIDDAKGVYVVDCSRYVDYVLKETFPSAYADLVNWSERAKPTTYDYYQYLTNLADNSSSEWNYIDSVETLRPGDILVFRYTNQKGRQTGGHIMIVMDTAKREGNVFFVRVSDSAGSGHGSDTRAKRNSGVGIGTLLLKVNPRTDQPIAYAWKEGMGWKHNVNIVMGRPAGQVSTLA